MKVKLDENLPLQIASLLRSFGHDVHTVPEEGLSGSDDSVIWNATQEEERFLITQDLDFSDERKFAPDTHHGIALIRLRFPNRANLIEHIDEVFRFEDIATWRGCFIVVTEHKVRVRRGADESFRVPHRH
jgi:predicted nuclease of predicted toxin-antitoxin system